MRIHDFKTLLSKVKVGDTVIVNWAHKYERGSWSIWSVHNFIVDTIDPVLGIVARLENHPTTAFRITEKEFKGNRAFKFKLPE